MHIAHVLLDFLVVVIMLQDCCFELKLQFSLVSHTLHVPACCPPGMFHLKRNKLFLESYQNSCSAKISIRKNQPKNLWENEKKFKIQREIFKLCQTASLKIYLTVKVYIRNEFYEDVVGIIPNSCYAELMAGKEKYQNPSLQKVPTIIECAESFVSSCDSELDVTQLSDVFVESLYFTHDQIKLVYELTKLQSNSNEWKEHRKARFTASKFKSIFACAEKHYGNTHDEYPLIISSVMGYEESYQTWQMKHGINTEIHAKSKFKAIKRSYIDHVILLILE